MKQPSLALGLILFTASASAQCRNDRFVSGRVAGDIINTSAVQVIAAPGSQARVDLHTVAVTNLSTTPTVVKVLNGGVEMMRNGAAASGGGFAVNFGYAPLKGELNANWSVQAETTGAALQVTFTGCLVP